MGGMELLISGLLGLLALYLVIYFAVLNAIREARSPSPVKKVRPWQREADGG